MTLNRTSVAVVALLVALTALPAMGEIDKPYRMEIGDPARKAQKADLVLDAHLHAFDTRSESVHAITQICETPRFLAHGLVNRPV